MPWLYYQEDANTILTDKSITNSYKFPDSKLFLTVSVFRVNGSFIGYRSVMRGLLQLCKNSDTFMDAAYVFGTFYEHTVSDAWLLISGIALKL